MRLFQTQPDVLDLKDYQRRVLEELGDYVERVTQLRGIDAPIGDPAEVALPSRPISRGGP